MLSTQMLWKISVTMFGPRMQQRIQACMTASRSVTNSLSFTESKVSQFWGWMKCPKLNQKPHCPGVRALLHKRCLFWKKRRKFRNRRLCFLWQGVILSLFLKCFTIIWNGAEIASSPHLQLFFQAVVEGLVEDLLAKVTTIIISEVSIIFNKDIHSF